MTPSNLLMSPLNISHVKHIMTWVNDPEVIKNFQHFNKTLSVKDEKKFVQNILKSKSDFVFSFFKKETGAYVGQGGIHQISWENKLGRLGVLVKKSQWNRGYGKEITRQLINHAFNDLKLHKIWAVVYASNKRSLYINKKLGFKKEGLLKDEYYWQGKYHDMVRLAILNKKPARTPSERSFIRAGERHVRARRA